MQAQDGQAARKNVVLGVTGSVAAYKAAYVASALTGRGCSVHAVMTRSAAKLVGPATFQAVTGNPVIMGMFHRSSPGSMPHIDLAAIADLFLVAPATANFIGKYAAGIADDALTTAALSCRAPVLVAPAMNSRMWEHPIVQQNVRALAAAGVEFIGPGSGRLACGDEGAGRLADPDEIVKRCLEILGPTA